MEGCVRLEAEVNSPGPETRGGRRNTLYSFKKRAGTCLK
jgi:hypothetical protein